MTKRIKHVSELPEWFKLEKYKKANSISDYAWHIQLIIRKYFLVNEYMPAFSEAIELVRNKTFVMLGDYKYFRHFYDRLSNVNVDNFIMFGSENPAVSSLTLRKFFSIQKNLPPEKLKYEPEFIDYIYDVMKCEKDAPAVDMSEIYQKCLEAPKQTWLHEPIYKSLPKKFGAEGLIYVDMDFPDDQLIEHFKKWLSNIRAELNIEMKAKYFKQSDFNSWSLYGVLPYIDLKIWEKENNVRIPNRVMADAIYLTGVGGEETVRKTTAPLVEHLLSEKTLNQLAGQIIIEVQKIKAEYEKEKNVPENI